MDVLRIVVTPQGDRYRAQSGDAMIITSGFSIEEAVEKARVHALELFGSRAFPMIVHIEEPRKATIVMQSADKPFSIDAAGKDRNSYFSARVDDDRASG